MKRKIILGLSIVGVLFLLACLYLLRIVNDSTDKLDNLVMLHQIEILRERYLLEINRVQMDLVLAEAGRPTAPEEVAEHARRMQQVVESCFDCHHTDVLNAELESLRERTATYRATLGRALDQGANLEHVASARSTALRLGEQLSRSVSDMIATTSAGLETRRLQAAKEVAASRTVLHAMLVGIPLVAALLAAVFISGHTRPLHALVESTRKLKAGDLSHRVTGMKHEVGELASAFNEMAISLQEQMTKMQRAEQLAVLGELAAGLAHEIKNPMAGIKVTMEVLQKEANLSGEDLIAVEKVTAEISRLETLMKDFLNFAKPPKPQLSEIDVNEVVGSTLAFYARSRLGGRQAGSAVEIVKQFGTLPAVFADPRQLEQVLLNLMINALDAMPDGGTLSVRTTSVPQREIVEVAVTDTGKGIDKRFADKIFNPFFTTKRGGTGLGLAISRQLIEQQGGELCSGDNPTGGSVFTIRLPVRLAQKGTAA